LFRNAVTGEPVAQAILPVGPAGILPVDLSRKEPGKMPGLSTARMAVLTTPRGAPELASPLAGSLKFRHFFGDNF